MNATYTLKHPFKSRRQGQDVEVTELPLPQVITVGLFRKAGNFGNQLLWAHQMTEAAAGLNAIDASKLMTPDAIGYVSELASLLEPTDEHPDFVIPEIRPVKALVKRITATPQEAAEFVAQVLIASGVKASDLDGMDVRKYLPLIQPVLEAMSDPK